MDIKIKVGEEKEGFSDWELEECMKTLEKASAIRKDKEKMEALKGFAEKKVKSIRSIADLKGAAQEARDHEAEEKILDPEDGLSDLDRNSIAKGKKSADY